MEDSKQELEQMIADYDKRNASQPDQSQSQPTVDVQKENASGFRDSNVNYKNDSKQELEQMIADYDKRNPEPQANQGQQKGQSDKLPSFSEYMGGKYDELAPTKDELWDFVGIKGPKSLFSDQSKKDFSNDLSKLASIGTGVLQGGADVGYGISRVPASLYNVGSYLVGSKSRMGEGVKPDFSITDYQKQAVQEHPYYHGAGEMVGSSAVMSPAFSGIDSAGQLLGRSAMAGYAATPSSDPMQKTAGATLGAVGTAVPYAFGKGAQSYFKTLTGTEIDPEAVNAYKALDIEDKVPHVYKTTDDNAKDTLVNNVLHAAGNGNLRDQVKGLSNELDNKTNEFLSDFDIKNTKGESLFKEDGTAPSQEEIKNNIDEKINKEFSQNKERVAGKYQKMDDLAKETGEKVDVNSYGDSLKSIVNWEPGQGQGRRPPESLVQFAKDELESLKKQNSFSRSTTSKYVDPATGIKDPPKLIEGQGTSFSHATDIKENINKALSNTDDQLEKSYLMGLKSSLMNDINQSVEKTGNKDIMSLWKDAESDYAKSVAPFREHEGLSKHLNEKRVKLSSDKILGSLVGQDNAISLSKALDLVPSIKDDLGFLKLRDNATKFSKKNVPDFVSAMQSLGPMRDGTGIALYGPEKWNKLGQFKTAHGKLGSLLDAHKNPATGQRVSREQSKKIFQAMIDPSALLTGLATGHFIPVLAGVGGKAAAKVGLNKMNASLMSSPAAFKAVNSQSMINPALESGYQSLLAGSGSQLAGKYNDEEGK